MLAVRLQELQRVASFQGLCWVEALLSSLVEGQDVESEARGAAGNARRPGQQLGVEHSPGPTSPSTRGPASPCGAGSQHCNSLLGKEDKQISVSNCLLYYLVSFGTELDNENFYILFFPFWIWNLDPFVGQRLCTKDIIHWRRPASPPVVKLEIFYNSEYSMPSTHAVSGTAIPIAMVLLTYGRWQYPLI
ncbi:sphingosine-1-phosphate phosphatase 1 [Sigmodon hispidus]